MHLAALEVARKNKIRFFSTSNFYNFLSSVSHKENITMEEQKLMEIGSVIFHIPYMERAF